MFTNLVKILNITVRGIKMDEIEKVKSAADENLKLAEEEMAAAKALEALAMIEAIHKLITLNK